MIPNENKISYRWLERALIGMEVWKSWKAEVVQRPAVSCIVWLGVAELEGEYGVTREHGVKPASARGADRLVLCPMNLLLVENRRRVHWLAVCARHRFGYRAAFAVSRDDHFPVA